MRISDWSSDVCSSDLIWSYGAATGPIAYLAQKDMQSGNGYGALAAFFSQVAFILVMLAILFFDPTGYSVAITFAVVMAIGMFLQLAIAYAESRRSEEHTSELQSLMRISYAVFCL